MRVIRTAERGDIAAVSGVLAASWKSAYRGIVHDEYLDALENGGWIGFLTEGMNGGGVFSMVLEENGLIVGAAILARAEEAGAANLVSFYLLPDKIGRGLGGAFLSGIEAELRSEGFAACVVDVLEDNKRAIRFYEAHGFTDARETVAAALGGREYLCKVYKKCLR